MHNIEFNQAIGGIIHVAHSIDDEPITGLTAAKYQLFDRSNRVVLTLQLGNGIEFIDGETVITITEQTAEPLSGQYRQECLVRDQAGRPALILAGTVNFNPIYTRIAL